MWRCGMDRVVNTGTPLYVTSSTTSGNYFANSTYYQTQIARLQSEIADSFRRYINDEIYNHITQTFTIDRAEAERIDAEFADRFRNFVNYECVATSDFEYDEIGFDENVSDELDEFLSAFKVKDKGVR